MMFRWKGDVMLDVVVKSGWGAELYICFNASSRMYEKQTREPGITLGLGLRLREVFYSSFYGDGNS